jgi:hypothetical protein
MKGAAATGVAATGITAFSGSAAAQEENLDVNADRLNINRQTGNARGLIVVQNIAADIIDDITVQDIQVNILSDDVDIDIEVSRLVQTQGGDVVRLIIRDNIRDIDILRDSNVAVVVNVLSDAGDVIQTGQDEIEV